MLSPEVCKVFTHRNAKTQNRKTAISRQPEKWPVGFLAQMKATDIRNKTSSHSSQNLRGRTLSFLAIYVLVTCGPVAPHCARMTNFIKHQIFYSSKCTTSPIFKLISITVWILWHFQKVPFSAHFRPIFLFPFSWGGGAPQTPSHISSFGPLGVRNNQHQKKNYAPEPTLKLTQSAPLKVSRHL